MDETLALTGFVPLRGLVRPLLPAPARPEMLADQELDRQLAAGVSKHHKDTHTAAVLDTRTGGVLARITVSTDRDGSAALVALAEQHSGLRAWASEGRPGNLGRNRSRAPGAPRALRTAERHDLAVTHQRQVSAAS